MGTDIYLRWDDQSKQEKESQYTGFSIRAGEVGYLRASIGMSEENGMLREIFPSIYWNPPEPKGLSEEERKKYWEDYQDPEYDFVSRKEKNADAITRYIGGETLPFDMLKAYPELASMITGLKKAAKKSDFHVECKESEDDMTWRVEYAQEVVKFLTLGEQLQKEGRHPRVCISW